MQASYRPTVAEINLDDLRANYEAFRRYLLKQRQSLWDASKEMRTAMEQWK